MSNLELINTVLRALSELIDACSAYQLAGAEHPLQPQIQLAPYRRVVRLAHELEAFAGSQLDNLCLEYLLTGRGEWSHKLVDTLRSPFRADSVDDFQKAIRERRYQLSKVGVILENDARLSAPPVHPATAAPTGTVKIPSPAWVRESDVGALPTNLEQTPPIWKDLGNPKQAILQVLNTAADALQNSEVATKAGYKPGTLRHHYGELKKWGLIELTKDGYKITSAGREILPPAKV
jgi:hypothetical protein